MNKRPSLKKIQKKALYIYNSPWFSRLELRYAKRLKKTRQQDKYPLINDNDINSIKKFLIATNSDFISLVDRVDSKEMLMPYCLVINLYQIYFLIKEQWFLVIASHYNCYDIVMLDAAGGKCGDIFLIFDFILENFKHKPFIASCRESTSYPLLLALEKHGRIKIINDYARVKTDEMMHYVKFRIIRHKRCRLRRKK